MSDKISIAIIGGGETGTSLMKSLLKYEFIEIVAIADLNKESSGFQFAKESGIKAVADLSDIIKMGNKVDIIADAVGKKEIRIALRYELKTARNDHTVIIPELIVLTMIAMSNNSREIPRSKHGFQVY